MSQTELSLFRKGLIVILSIGFAGALLVFTAQANLDLLKSLYPNPQFYMFGLLALEGGIIYWEGYYLLNRSGIHKAISLVSLFVDALLSGVGFFYEMENVTHAQGTITLPPVIVIVGFAVVFNVAMAIVTHLIPTTYVATRVEQPHYSEGYAPRQLAQEASLAPSVSLRERVIDGAASLVSLREEVQEKVQERRARSVTPQKSIDTERLEAVTEPKKQ